GPSDIGCPCASGGVHWRNGGSFGKDVPGGPAAPGPDRRDAPGRTIRWGRSPPPLPNGPASFSIEGKNRPGRSAGPNPKDRPGILGRPGNNVLLPPATSEGAYSVRWN